MSSRSIKLRVVLVIVMIAVAACGQKRARQPVTEADRTAAPAEPVPEVLPWPGRILPRLEPPPAQIAPAVADVGPPRWLEGFAATAISEQATISAEDQLGPPPPNCESGDTRAQVVVGDLSPDPGVETVVASTAHGLIVIDANGRHIGATSLGCGGSADELVALATGAIDEVGPVIAVVATRGGRREAVTRVELFRIDAGAAGLDLVSIFAAPIETRDGDEIASGSVRIVPGGLVQRRPGGGSAMWRYDRSARSYVRVERERNSRR